MYASAQPLDFLAMTENAPFRIGNSQRSIRSFLMDARLGPLTYNLRIPLGNCVVFRGSEAQREFFRARIRSQHAVWMHSAKVDALFRVDCGF